MEYTPEVKWVPRKTHYIADALSRSPLCDTNDDDYIISYNYQSVETAWNNIKERVKTEKYATVQQGICDTKTSQYKTLIHRLSLRQIDKVIMVILDSARLIIPESSQRAVLTELHKVHSGICKTYTTATQLYYWPGMKNCIKTFIADCKTCLKHSPSQARTPVTGTAPSAAISPMNSIGVDLFDADGKKWLAVFCRYSGYAWLSHLRKKTSLHIIEQTEQLICGIWISRQYSFRRGTSISFGICGFLLE